MATVSLHVRMNLTLILWLFLWNSFTGCAKGLEVNTTPTITAIRGQSTTLPCTFRGTPIGVFWYRHNSTGGPDSESEIVVQHFQGKVYNRAGPKYNITSDYAMVIYNVSVADETTYSCDVALDTNEDGRNYTNVRIIALANPRKPVIGGCVNTSPDRCDYSVTKVEEVFQLICQVNLVRPAVNLTWTSTTGANPPTERSTMKGNSEGLFNVSLIAKVSKSQIGHDLICTAEGEAVNGTSRVTVTTIANNVGLPTLGKVLIPVVLVLVAIVLAIAIPAAVLYHRQKRGAHTKDPEAQPMSPTEHAEVTERRSKIETYEPGTWTARATDSKFEAPKKVNIGLLGVQGSGKSSLINSFLFAMKGKWVEEAVEGKRAGHGGETTDRQIYNLTANVGVTDNRGMKDFRTTQVLEDIIPQLERNRGVDPGREIENGIPVDCPVLVYKFSNMTDVKHCQDFLREFVSEVRKHLGSYPITVVTFANDVEKTNSSRKSFKNELLHMKENDIYFIDNYTDQSHSKDTEKDIELLKILQACIKRADDGIVTRDRKAREKPTQKGKLTGWKGWWI